MKSLLLKQLNNKNRLGIFLGPLVDLETVMLSKYLGNLLGSSDIYSDHKCEASSSLDLRTNYSFTCFGDLKKADVCLVIGCDIRSEASTLNLLIKKQVTEGLLTVGYIGPAIDLTYPFKHLGLDIESFISLMKGKHPFSSSLKNSKNPCIILGERFNSNNILKTIHKLINLNCLKNLSESGINLLRKNSSSISLSELGINSQKVNKKYNLLFLIGVEDLKHYRLTNPDSFIVYIGSHYSVYNLEMADLILPSSIFIEKDFKIINLENIVKESKSLRKISGNIRSEWFILLVIISYFNKDINSLHLEKKKY